MKIKITQQRNQVIQKTTTEIKSPQVIRENGKVVLQHIDEGEGLIIQIILTEAEIKKLIK